MVMMTTGAPQPPTPRQWTNGHALGACERRDRVRSRDVRGSEDRKDFPADPYYRFGPCSYFLDQVSISINTIKTELSMLRYAFSLLRRRLCDLTPSPFDEKAMRLHAFSLDERAMQFWLPGTPDTGKKDQSTDIPLRNMSPIGCLTCEAVGP